MKQGLSIWAAGLIVFAAVGMRADEAADRALLEELGEAPVARVLGLMSSDARLFNEHVVSLADPFMEGRSPGSAGIERAAEYLEFHLSALGLEPVFPGDDGPSYRQTFSRGTTLHAERQEMRYRTGDGQVHELTPDEQFRALGFSGNGEASGPLIFCGYGIPEGPDGYTSFAEGEDLSGKIALVMRFEPLNDKGRSRWSESGDWTDRGSLDAKVAAAAERGAAGVILVSPPGTDDWRARRLDSLNRTRPRGDPFAVPVVMITPEAGEDLVRAGDAEGRSLTDLRTLADEHGGTIDLGGVTVTLAAEIERSTVYTDNVGAVLTGRGDLADEYVVVGAHYDHLGARGGAIYHGADDNASGTAGTLVVARNMVNEYQELGDDAEARSVIFVLFTAEESGLVGSRHFVSNPPVPIEQIVFMLNLDMIGRLREGRLEVVGRDSADGLSEWLTPYFEASGLTIVDSDIGDRSDHASFLRGGVPAMFFFTGLHPEYHQPTDVSDLINRAGAGQIIGLGTQVVLGVAQRPERFLLPEPEPEPPAEEVEAAPEPPAPMRGRLNVSFGVATGQSEEPGVMITRVFEGSAAAAAGIQAGDRITKWNDTDLTDRRQWMQLLLDANPGDEVTIVYVRSGEERTTRCTLKARG